ncbi:hypothetical protein SAMN04488034_101455 [Salinimicrobium catena]|uniref:Uncharacterized protein n=1 Tax=Salinimicrobium catena TaxID=390640 RepID=A0A1H5IK82_9FLAO|nr:hypothetical protein SAMN04488140_101455 [Salinimicrobium catena]SEE40622.1 hypothetical protein SAMN04488034_101455 [Salinimicrobium catena]
MIFVLIFLVGVLSFVASINHSLNNPEFSSCKDFMKEENSADYSLTK